MKRAALRCSDSSDDSRVPGNESQAAEAYSISGRTSCLYAVTLMISELVITLRLTKPRAAFALATTDVIWSLQVILELIVTPRYLVLSTLGICVECSLNVWFTRLVVFLVKVTCSHFSGWNSMSHSFSQVSRRLRSACSISWFSAVL